MRAASPAFISAEAQPIQTPDVCVTIRPNPEALQWSPTFTGTGKTGVAGAWQGSDEIDSMAIITPAGTLLRIHAAGNGGDPSFTLYLNRVPTGAGLPTQSQLQNWTAITTGHQRVTRAALSADATRVRVFYIKAVNPSQLVYRDSLDDGQTWSGEMVLDAGTTTTWSIAALASPRPDYLFVCRRQFSPPHPTDPQVEWLTVTAFQFENSAWLRTDHPRTTTRTTLNSNSFWTAALQFDAAWVDESKGIACCVLLDDLAGRPAATRYQNRHWSDFTPIEAIDFAEPERDEVIGLKLRRVGNKLLLFARRTQADSDFVASRMGVLYYSTDGLRWSDAYYVMDGYTSGVPLLWRDRLWLVGTDSLWSATPTAFFGGMSPNAIDATTSTVQIQMDEPESLQSVVSGTVELDNTYRQWTSHPALIEGAELVVEVGYQGAERLPLYLGRIGPPQPRSDTKKSAIQLTAVDTLATFGRGTIDRALWYPNPYRRDIRFATADDLEQLALPSGSAWGFVSFGGETYMRAMNVGPNSAGVATGIRDRLRVSARFRIVNQEVGQVTGESNAQSSFALLWHANIDLSSYYLIRAGAGSTRFELWKTRNGQGEMLARSASGGPAVPINQWFQITVVSTQGRMVVTYQFAGSQQIFVLFDYADPSPTYAGTVVAVRGTLTTESPDQNNLYRTVDVDDLLVVSEVAPTTLEEVVTGLAMMRGFDQVNAEQRLLDTFTGGLAGWVQLGVAGGWSTDAQGLHYTSVGKFTSDYRALRSSLIAQDLLVDVDLRLGDTITSSAVFGVLARSSVDGSSRADLLIHARWDSSTATYETTIILQITNTSGVTTTYRQMSACLLYPGRTTTARFTARGPWYSVAINGLHAATFYDATLIREGYWGLSDGVVGVIGGTAHVTRIAVPWLGVGSVPMIEPKDQLDKALKTILDGQNAWMMADGRTLRLGVTIPSSTPIPVSNLWLDGGYQPSTQPIITHCRVTSEVEGLEITGTAIATNLWRQHGASVWRYEDVPGLRTEAECRARAQAFILESERNRRPRSYRVHPQLRWQKHDRLDVTNILDDTAQPLIVVGTQRTWTQDRASGAWSCAMTVRLDEENTNVVTFAPTTTL